ncbi:MAG: DUF1569 domain-containing protein [Bacteroidetes bacterium]|nr:DUF1569 domain-containing protein [Bacteroidota bacterium]
MKNLFNEEEAEACIQRIERLTNDSTALWGKMNAAQMLAHLCVQYDMAFSDKYPKPGRIARFFLHLFVRDTVIGNKPYKRNSPTAPAFRMDSPKNFEEEKKRLIGYIQKAQEAGESYFEGKESLSFGKLSARQWNVMFSKHNDHHLSQFGV